MKLFGLELKRRKGIAELANQALGIILVAIIVMVGLRIIKSTNTSMGFDTDVSATTGDAVDVLDDVMDWLSIIVVVIFAALVIGYLLNSFRGGVGPRQ